MDLINNGKTRHSVLIEENAPESIIIAAGNLSDLIEKSTGVKLWIKTSCKAPFISIGKTQAEKELGINVNADELNDDGFKILFRNGNIYLIGATERSLVYAANDFAERYLGVRFLTADETYIPKHARVIIEEKDVVSIPDFKSRGYFAYGIKRSPSFASRMRLVSQYADDAEAQKYGGGFLRDWNSYEMHSMLSVMPREKYYSKHKEWYSSDKPRAWLCLTNGLTDEDKDDGNPESLISEISRNIIEKLKARPEIKYFMLGHEDSSGAVYCNCERCRRSRERNKTVSGYLMVWINAIARRIEKWRVENCPERDVKLVSFAYLDTIIPPVYVKNQDGLNKPYIFLEREYWAPLKVRQGEIVPINDKVIPEKNVVIFLAPIGTCYLHEMTDERCDWNMYFKFAFEGWKALGNNIMVWYYGVNFSYHLWWFPNRRTMRSHLEFYKKYKPLFIMQQGAPREGGFYQAILNTYLISKLMWDTSLDVNALTAEFNELYFGKEIAADINEFIVKMENQYEFLKEKYDGQYHSDIGKSFKNSLLAENFPYDFLVDCIEILENAIKKAKDEKTRTKIKRVSLHPLYMLAHNFKEYKNADVKYLDMLEKYLKDTGMVCLCEGNKTPETVMKELREGI